MATYNNIAVERNVVGSVFVATIGTTTFTELEAAYLSGDYDCFICKNNSGTSIGYLNYYSTWFSEQHYFVFESISGNLSNKRRRICWGSAYWSSQDSDYNTGKIIDDTLMPSPPTSGKYKLVSNNGTMSWEADE